MNRPVAGERAYEDVTQFYAYKDNPALVSGIRQKVYSSAAGVLA